MATRLGESDQDLQHFVSLSPWSADVLLEALAKATVVTPPAYWIIDFDELSEGGQPLGGRAAPVLRGVGQDGQLPTGGEPASRRRGGGHEPTARLAALFAGGLGGRSRPLPARGRPGQGSSTRASRTLPSDCSIRPSAGSRRWASCSPTRHTAAASSGVWPCVRAISFTACACRGRPPAGKRSLASVRPRRCVGAFALSAARCSARSRRPCWPSHANCLRRRGRGQHGGRGPRGRNARASPPSACGQPMVGSRVRSQNGLERLRSSSGRTVNPRPLATGWHACPGKGWLWPNSSPPPRRAWRVEQDYRELKDELGPRPLLRGEAGRASTTTLPWSPPPSSSCARSKRHLHRRAQKKPAAAAHAAAGAPLAPSRAHPPERALPVVSHMLPSA